MINQLASDVSGHWDCYEVCRRLVHSHPIRIPNPAASTGCMDSRNAKGFWISVAEYPDPLQDVLFVIAHAQGFEASLAALDRAIREQLAERRTASNVILHPTAARQHSRPLAPEPGPIRAAS